MKKGSALNKTGAAHIVSIELVKKILKLGTKLGRKTTADSTHKATMEVLQEEKNENQVAARKSIDGSKAGQGDSGLQAFYRQR
jgi:hypothetical protein